MVCFTISSDIITIDLHGLRFIEAKTELLDCLEGYFKQGFNSFEVIHGFKSGTVLKDYVRLKLKKDFEKRSKHCSLLVKKSSEGSTLVSIKIL